MTDRLPVSAPQNAFFDGEDISNTNLTLEQTYGNTIFASIRSNHFGSGVLPDSLTQKVLFNSSTISGILDGKALFAQAQPSDNNLGNQLEVSLTGSTAAGNRSVKVLIIGLDFEQNLQYDALTFHKNETQFTSQHYTAILTVLVNDLSRFSNSIIQSWRNG